MSLRFKLFFLFSSLIVILLAAQWWMWGRLTQDLDRELGSIAFSVGTGMMETLSERHWITKPTGDVSVIEDEDDLPVWEILEGDDHIELVSSDGKQVREIKKLDKKIMVFGEGDSDIEIHREFKHDSEATYTFVTKQKGDAGQSVKTKVIMTRDGDTVNVSRDGETVDVAEVVEEALSKLGDIERDHQETLRVDIDTDIGNAWKHAMELENMNDISAHIEEQMEAVGDALVEAHTIRIALDDPQKARFLVVEGEEDRKHEIPIQTAGIADSLDEVRQRFLLGSLVILAVGLALSAALAHRFTTPLRQLATAASEVGDGHFGHQVEMKATGEVGVAIASFNTMSRQLQELEAKNHAMQQRAYLSELGEVANGLAHTLRNPLNTLGLSVEQMAAMNPENEQGSELAKLARQQIRRIDQWVRSFLALASQGVTHSTELDFVRIIQDVVLEAIQDSARDVDLDMDLPEALPSVPGVAPEMRAVLQALIVNAVEASPDGSSVAIRVVEGDGLRILVEDEGPGVDPAIREKLFSPHVTTKETGSGMGLFLANRIIASRYGGNVSLDDRPTGGTVATVFIPLEDA